MKKIISLLKQNKVLLAIIFCSTVLAIIISCQKEIKAPKQNEKIEKAKAWFQNYIAGFQPHFMFQDVTYRWDLAKIEKHKNSYETIVVPIQPEKFVPEYQGQRSLIIYPWKNGKGYYASVLETIFDQAYLIQSKGYYKISNFSGIMNVWNLKTGFTRGAYIKNGEMIGLVNLKILTPASTRTMNPPPTMPQAVYVYAFYHSPNANHWYNMEISMNGTLFFSDVFDPMAWGFNPCEYSGCNNGQDVTTYFDETFWNNYWNAYWAAVQNAYCDYWMTSSIKDSTDNPCIGSVLSTLKSIDSSLPRLIASFFGTLPTFNVTPKTETISTWTSGGGSPEGGHTAIISPGNFNIFFNNYFANRTDLGTAATMIHELFHAQLRDWFQKAILDSNVTLQQQLAADYGYIFGDVFSLDSSLLQIVNNGDPSTHQDMINRYKGIIAQALYQFAQAKGINITLSYCEDLAWTGTFDCKAYQNLSYSTQQRIKERVGAEKDPYSNLWDPSNTYGVNSTGASPKGHPCP